MKKIISALLLSVPLFMGSCSDDPEISVSQTEFHNVECGETALSVNIKTSGVWTATSLNKWLVPSAVKGENDAELIINVSDNVAEERTGKVVVRGVDGTLINIHVNQQGYPIDQEYTYELPVIFHVLYKSRSDRKQFVDYSRIVKILENVNKLYDGVTVHAGGDQSVNMNLQFVLAKTDEEGNPLQLPGVEYIKWDEMPIDCEQFMGSRDQKNLDILWDHNRYINVVLYNFAATGGNGTILGISHMPYTIAGPNALPGLGTSPNNYISKENLSYPHCVSINTLFAYEDKGTGDQPNSGDITVTVAHELGHYLGLHHAFDEAPNGGLSTDCIDSDFCKDTPSYNRNAYMQELLFMMQQAAQMGTYVPYSKGAVRIDCNTAEEFMSYNIMDYEITYADRFTADQRKRIRNVLTYSPLMPGPKKGAAGTRTIVHGKLDLPVKTVKCYLTNP